MEHLPEPIIQRIQYFLTGKEAARNTLLSKSWSSACLTRPDLDFDEQEYHSETDEFWDVVRKCMKRYEQSNLNIQSFVLSMKHYTDHLLANQIIVEALRIGATRLAIRVAHGQRDYVILKEIFASENLVELSLTRGTIRDYDSVRCLRLQSLTLDNVTVRNNVIAHILSHCRLIEKFSLWGRYQYKFSFFHEEITGTIVDDCSIELPKMHNLRSLMLSGLRFKTL